MVRIWITCSKQIAILEANESGEPYIENVFDYQSKVKALLGFLEEV